jgi:hypothetical protein
MIMADTAEAEWVEVEGGTVWIPVEGMAETGEAMAVVE